jgi:hypothetical protein
MERMGEWGRQGSDRGLIRLGWELGSGDEGIPLLGRGLGGVDTLQRCLGVALRVLQQRLGGGEG